MAEHNATRDGTKGKTGLELSDNARRDFIVHLAEELRELDSATAILELAARLLGEFLHAERAGAYCLDQGRIVFEASWSAGSLPQVSGSRPIDTIGAKIIERYRARQTVVTTDVAADGVLTQGIQGTSTTYSAIGVPLFRKGRWEGSFFINREAGQPWRPSEIWLTEEVAQLSWDAHERAQAAENLRQANEALKQREETQRLLVYELDHRIKNMLSLVVAIASNTIRNAETLHGARVALIERIQALAGAHDVLVKSQWGPAGIRQVIATGTLPYPELAKRISFTGPDCMLSTKQALMFALGLHELVTNAVKYGALSNEQGNIAVTWKLAGEKDSLLAFAWSEDGGPPVATPLRTGFGTRILNEILPVEFNGRANLDYARRGLQFRMEGKLADT